MTINRALNGTVYSKLQELKWTRKAKLNTIFCIDYFEDDYIASIQIQWSNDGSNIASKLG